MPFSLRGRAEAKFTRCRLRGGRFGLYFDQPGGHTVEQCELVIDNGEVAA